MKQNTKQLLIDQTYKIQKKSSSIVYKFQS